MSLLVRVLSRTPLDYLTGVLVLLWFIVSRAVISRIDAADHVLAHSLEQYRGDANATRLLEEHRDLLALST